MVEASISIAAVPGSISHFRRGSFPRSSHTSDLMIGTTVAAMPGADVPGSSLGLVGPVSVYCDRVG